MICIDTRGFSQIFPLGEVGGGGGRAGMFLFLSFSTLIQRRRVLYTSVIRVRDEVLGRYLKLHRTGTQSVHCECGGRGGSPDGLTKLC
jgi:hypothetical protein